MNPIRRLLRDGMYVFLSLCFCAAFAPDRLPGQDQPQASSWHAWQFLLGEWVGEGGGSPGEGAGTFSFSTDLQGRVLVRRGHTDFPPTQNRPAFSHDDLMVLYRDEANPVRAMYFDNEGHVIRYATAFSGDSNSVIFLSDTIPGAPRFRLTYAKRGEGLVEVRFDIAPPGTPDAFRQYLKATARRK
jgi:hypothetical protein